MSLLVGEALSFFGALADSVAGIQPERTERVRAMCATLGRLLELPGAALRVLDAAAVLRNAGIFTTQEEYERPACGARICETLTGLPSGISDTVRWQCEFWDGTGYPDRLRAGEIPRTCRILSTACSYAACTSDEQAHALLTGESGRVFAPDTTAAFVTWYHARSATTACSDLTRLEWIETVEAENVFAVLRRELNVAEVREHAVPVLDRFETLAPIRHLLSEHNT